MRNAIITAADGYHVELLKPFINSMAKHCQNTDLFIIANTEPSETLSYAKSLGINAYFSCANMSNANQFYCKKRFWRRIIKGITPAAIFQKMAYSSVQHISVIRTKIALELIKTEQNNYSKILLSDSRDVIFQSNPFELITADTPATFGLEDIQLQDERFTRTWIQRGFGIETYDKISDTTVGCSGVIIGGTKPMIDYLHTQTQLTHSIQGKIAYEYGFDQGIHNVVYYLHNDNLNMQTVNNGSALICTLATCNSSEYTLTDDNKLQFTETGNQPAIVHQYDRNSMLIDPLSNAAVN